jgi:hypothetical protein
MLVNDAIRRTETPRMASHVRRRSQEEKLPNIG